MSISATTALSQTTVSAPGGKAAPVAAPESRDSRSSKGSEKPKASSGHAPAASSTAAKALVKMANGEYTAASVTADAKDAMALGLVKQKDGNYAAQAATPDASTAARSSSGVQAALNDLKLGG